MEFNVMKVGARAQSFEDLMVMKDLFEVTQNDHNVLWADECWDQHFDHFEVEGRAAEMIVEAEYDIEKLKELIVLEKLRRDD